MSAGVPSGRVIALSGGGGGAKLVAGLAQIVPDGRLTVIVNTGDDFEHLGLHISPDIDSVLYALGRRNDEARGWGRDGETWNFMASLRDLSTEIWFQLGDKDLAVHMNRTWRLRLGRSLSDITAEMCTSYGIGAQVLPMTDAPVRTRVLTAEGELEFQRYFVERKCAPPVIGFDFPGADVAKPPPSAAPICDDHWPSAVIICPSNPYVSIGPILSIKQWVDWLRLQKAPVVAVSPFIGGEALKGPAAKMMRELGLVPSTASLAVFYGDLVDGWIIHCSDAEELTALQAQGIRAIATNTIMRNFVDRTRLASEVLQFATNFDSR